MKGPVRGQLGAVSSRSFGVEEELLLVEPGTGRPMAVAGTVLRAARGMRGLGSELQEQQLETTSRPCRTLEELHCEVRRCRADAAEAAGKAGVQVAALATSPVPVEPAVVAGRAAGAERQLAVLAGG